MSTAVSRRAFLGAAGAASLVALPRVPAGAVVDDVVSTERLDVDVVVVGGTLTGLVAGSEFRRRGVRVVVLETASTTGGTEGWALGGHQRLIRLAQRVGTTSERLPVDGVTLEATADGARKVAHGAWTGDSRAASEIASALTKLDRMAWEVDIHAPWATVNASVRDARTLASWLDESVVGQTARRRLGQAFELAFGGPATEMSLLFALVVLASAGGAKELLRAAYYPELWLKDGLANLCDSFGGRMPGLVRRCNVHRMEADRDGVTIEASTCTVRARQAVLADSLGADALLGHVPSRFGAGTLALALCTYPSVPWWRDSVSGRVIGDGTPVHAVQPIGDGQTLVAMIAGGAAREWLRLSPEDRRAAVLRALGSGLGPRASDPSLYREVTGTTAARVMAPPGAISALGPELRKAGASVWRAGPETATGWIGYGEGLVEAGQHVAAQVAAEMGA